MSKLKTVLLLDKDDDRDLSDIRDVTDTLYLVRGFLPFGLPESEGKAGLEGGSVRSWLGPIAVPGQFITFEVLERLISGLRSASRSVQDVIDRRLEADAAIDRRLMDPDLPPIPKETADAIGAHRVSIAPDDVIQTYAGRIDHALEIVEVWRDRVEIDEALRGSLRSSGIHAEVARGIIAR